MIQKKGTNEKNNFRILIIDPLKCLDNNLKIISEQCVDGVQFSIDFFVVVKKNNHWLDPAFADITSIFLKHQEIIEI